MLDIKTKKYIKVILVIIGIILIVCSFIQNSQNSLAIEESGMFVTREGSVYKIKYRYGNQTNMIIEFDELGPNRVIQPRRFYKEEADQLNDDFSTPELWYTVGTDWVSPYGGIMALTGETTDFMGTVGGNHGTPEGASTGEPISSEMLVDGKTINSGEIVYCQNAQIIVKNYVSASNKIHINTGKKNQSVIETVTYTVMSGNIEVDVHLEALEDVRFDGYVGFQLTTNMYDGYVYFNDGPEKYKPEGVRRDSLSLPWKGDRVVYSGEHDLFIAYTNREVGLGDLSFKADQPIMHLAENNKIYAHLLGTSITLLKGESMHYSGGYTIIEPMEMKGKGAEAAYFISVNGERIYCVDFLEMTDSIFLKFDEEYHGKEIDIIEKTDSIIASQTITKDGLELKASDSGYIKFKIR